MYQNFYQNSISYPYNSYSNLNMNTLAQSGNINNANFNSNTNITFVSGIEGAKAFMCSPNSNILLVDDSNNNIYVKSTDSLGKSSICSYELVKQEISPTLASSSNKDINAPSEITNIKERLSLIENVINKLKPLVEDNVEVESK